MTIIILTAIPELAFDIPSIPVTLSSSVTEINLTIKDITQRTGRIPLLSNRIDSNGTIKLRLSVPLWWHLNLVDVSTHECSACA